VALGAVVTKLKHILDELHDTGYSRLIVIELEHKIAMLEAERRWVGNLEKEIKDGRLEWKVRVGPVTEGLRRKHGSGAH
jgi:hypothetical protein